MSNTIPLLFESIQYFYLFYLAATNIVYTKMIYEALRQIIWFYHFNLSNLIQALYSFEVYEPISILVPAYNEQETIISSVYSLLKLRFKEYEVIIINDGSKDETLKRIVKHFNLYKAPLTKELKLKHQKIRNIYRSKVYKNLIVIDKENGGKSDALNSGINISSYPLICCVDADTILERDSILYGLGEFFKDKRIIAVGGAIGSTNGSIIKKHKINKRKVPNTLVEGLQILEYLRGFLAGRLAWQNSNGLILISGAFGIFKKDIVLKIGGYRHTIGEDFDLLIRMRKYCYDNNIEHRVKFISDIVCWTQTPSDYASLLKQRNRWHRGLLETLFYHRKMLFNPKYGVVGMLSLPYFLLFEAFSPIITFIGSISIIVLCIFGFINSYTILLFFLLEFMWGLMLNIFALYLDLFTKRRYINPFAYVKLFFLSLLEPFFYKPLLKAELFMATFNFMNSNWGEIKRKAL